MYLTRALHWTVQQDARRPPASTSPGSTRRPASLTWSSARPAGARTGKARVPTGELLDRLACTVCSAARRGELSGGQAQRVAVARALAGRPAVIFADEPTGSLDTLARETVLDLLVDRARAQGATVVLVTHDARVASFADRQVVVRDGLVSTLTAA